jgi:metal-responsive CopG/Arc/MetJ family transcriptional regulator
MQRLTVSLPENLVKRVKHISREGGLKISRIVATALEQQLGEQTPRPAEPPIHPTVL